MSTPVTSTNTYRIAEGASVRATRLAERDRPHLRWRAAAGEDGRLGLVGRRSA